MNRFEHLKYALAFILVFVGMKMVLHQVWHIPIWLSLGVILGAVLVGVGTSMFVTRNSLPPPPPGGRKPPSP
jgi:tellurite resistance protein TerC